MRGGGGGRSSVSIVGPGARQMRVRIITGGLVDDHHFGATARLAANRDDRGFAAGQFIWISGHAAWQIPVGDLRRSRHRAVNQRSGATARHSGLGPGGGNRCGSADEYSNRERCRCCSSGSATRHSCPYRKLNPDVLVVQSAQNWHRQYATEGLDDARRRRVLV